MKLSNLITSTIAHDKALSEEFGGDEAANETDVSDEASEDKE